MRTKSYILCFVCIVGTTVLFLLVGDQKPSFQSIVTETHKQFASNIRSLKDNLKGVDETKLEADGAHLTQLGFVAEPRLYPAAVWTNTSLPVIVSYLIDGHTEQGVSLARHIAHLLPNHTLLLYSLGLSRYQLQLVQLYCNNSRCMIIDFDLNLFPSFVADETKLHAYRPLVIQDALNRAGAVLFLECDQRLATNKLSALLSKAQETGVVSWATRQAVTSLTHPRMFDYFHTTDESFFFLPMVEANKLLIYNTKAMHQHVMLPWVQCALIHDCIMPIGAQSVGCRFDKKPQYRYSGCHSYDSSALNIVLGVHFQLDELQYAYQDAAQYFYRVSLDAAVQEVIRLAENSTSLGDASSLTTDS